MQIFELDSQKDKRDEIEFDARLEVLFIYFDLIKNS